MLDRRIARLQDLLLPHPARVVRLTEYQEFLYLLVQFCCVLLSIYFTFDLEEQLVICVELTVHSAG